MTEPNPPVGEYVLITSPQPLTNEQRRYLHQYIDDRLAAGKPIILDGGIDAKVRRVVSGDFQSRVGAWMLTCFGPEISADRRERNHRFLEEALELVQSLDCTTEEAHQLVDYVFSRPVGDPHQETGGVMVTLAALCNAADLSMGRDGEDELDRVNSPEIIDKIRRKQAAKPQFSPLPGNLEASHD